LEVHFKYGWGGGTTVEIQTEGFGEVELVSMDTYMDTVEKEVTALVL
jgi:hypothetical protein